MFLSFRVDELKALLAHFKRPKNGRKEDLLRRVRELLNKGNLLDIQAKIREIYMSRPYLHMGLEERMKRVLAGKSMNAQRSIIKGFGMAHKTDVAAPVPVVDGAPSFSGQQVSTSQQAVDVKLAELPFYDFVEELVKPTLLFANAPERHYQENFFSFAIGRHVNIKDLFYPENMLPPRLEVQLRICQYDELREQLDDFPMNMVIRLNDNLVTLPQAVSVRKDETPKRPGRPIDVTRLCRAHCNNQRLYVQWEVEAGKNWVITVNLVCRQPVSSLLTRLLARPTVPRSKTEQNILESFADNSTDSDICATTILVSTDCPLSRRRLEYPCRSSVCKHLQCFDAKVFLEMNEKRASWICPVCYHPALYKDLIIDEYFINVIKQLPPGCSEIEINDDGSWVPVIKKETKKDGEAEPSDTPVMNCLVAPNEPDSPDSEVSTDCCIPRESNERTNRAKFLGLVDLTQESDDEDDDDGSKQGGASVGSHSTKSSTTSSSVIVLDSPQAAIATTPEDPITFKSVEDVLIMSGFGDCLPPPVKKRVVASMYRRDGSNDYRHQTTSSHQHRCSTAATSNARPAETLMDALGGGRRIPHGSAGADNCFPYFTSMFNCPVPSESMCPQSYGQGNGRINESVPAEYTGSANTYISPSYEPYMSSIYRSSMVPNGSHSDVTGKQVDGSIVDSYSRRTRPVAAHHVMYDRMNGHTDSALRSSLINDPSRSYTYSGPPPSTHPFTACMTATYQAQAQTQYVRSYISKRNQ